MLPLCNDPVRPGQMRAIHQLLTGNVKQDRAAVRGHEVGVREQSCGGECKVLAPCAGEGGGQGHTEAAHRLCEQLYDESVEGRGSSGGVLNSVLK